MINSLIEYISKLSKVPVHELSMDIEIYNSNIISSLNLLELMSYIEQQFNVVIMPEDLIETNFKDIKTLVKFIEFKQSNSN